MPKPEQGVLPIALALKDLGQRAGKRLLCTIKEVIRESGKQEAMAVDLGVSPEMLSQALSGQRGFRVEWMVPLLRYDRDLKILKYLAWEMGCLVSPVQPLTEGEKYRLLVAELKRGGADVESLEKRAYAEGEPS